MLSSAYILWMYKRIFFGKMPEQYVNVKDPSRYLIVTMAVLAAMTLVLGVYPGPLLNPLTGYIQSMFEGDASVLPIPTAARASDGSDVPVKSNTLLPSISLGGRYLMRMTTLRRITLVKANTMRGNISKLHCIILEVK